MSATASFRREAVQGQVTNALRGLLGESGADEIILIEDVHVKGHRSQAVGR
jgi:hypothetical protein